jgi:hypothetical protein
MWSKRDNLSPMKDPLKLYTAYSVKLSTEGLLCSFLYLANFTSHKLLSSDSLALYKDSSYIKGRVVCDLQEG